MTTVRVLPPGVGRHVLEDVHGRRYDVAPGNFVDAPVQDANFMGANGWITPRWNCGTTAERPTAAAGGAGVALYFLQTPVVKGSGLDGATSLEAATHSGGEVSRRGVISFSACISNQ